MERFVYIDSCITALILFLSIGMLIWLIRSIGKNNQREFKKGLAWVVPLLAIAFIDVFICLAIIAMLPGAPSGVDASDGLYPGKVFIQWKPAPRATAYSVLRAEKSGGEYTEIAVDIPRTSFVDMTAPPGKYYYKIVATNDIGKSIQSSRPDSGKPAITDLEFFKLYQDTEQISVGKLKKLGTLGQETEGGNIGGSITYDARFDGRAHVLSSFSNYCDFDKNQGNHIVLNGSFMTETDILGNGTLIGRVDVAGNYSGYVRYNLIIGNKKKSGGYYVVNQSGAKSATTIPWNVSR
jgi:hypothetical protein